MTKIEEINTRLLATGHKLECKNEIYYLKEIYHGNWQDFGLFYTKQDALDAADEIIETSLKL